MMETLESGGGGVAVLNGGVAVLNPAAVITPAIEMANKQRKKKFTGGNASKRHRDRVNIEFNNLAQLLPFPESVISKLDKSSILRLAVSYIRAKSFFKDIASVFENEVEGEKKSVLNGELEQQIQEGTGLQLSQMFSQALDGFLLVLTEDMKVLFVSESVRDYLGYCQAGIIHENFLQFLNPTDEHIIKSSMLYQQDELNSNVNSNKKQLSEPSFLSDQLLRGFDGRGRVQSVAQRQFVCRMKCAFSCSSRFYTAYRTFQFSGHLRRSSIQEGRDEKQLNTLVVFGTPLTSTNSTIDVVADTTDKSNNLLSYENSDEHTILEKVHNGFRIEPTLRPHIAPIPVTSHEITTRRVTAPPCVSTQPKQCNKPSQITSDVYHRQSYLLSQNMQTYRKRIGYAASLDSRYSSDHSNHSDDSKNSPVSSPNLMWRQSRSVSPPQYNGSRIRYYESSKPQEYILIDERAEQRRRNVILEAEYRNIEERLSPNQRLLSDQRLSPNQRLLSDQRLSPKQRFLSDQRHLSDERLSPNQRFLSDQRLLADQQRLLADQRHSSDRYAVYEKHSDHRNDVYLGAHMLMNLKYKEKPSPQPSRYVENERLHRKHSHSSDEDILPKRIKSVSPPSKATSFNISCLLGMDENKQLNADSSHQPSEQYIDVCNDVATKDAPFREMIHTMSKNLDDTFRKTMSAI